MGGNQSTPAEPEYFDAEYAVEPSTVFFDAEYAEEHTPEEVAAARAAKLKESQTTNEVGETILSVVDWIPFVGAITRSTQGIVKTVQGDVAGGIGSTQQATLNLAFDVIPVGQIIGRAGRGVGRATSSVAKGLGIGGARAATETTVRAGTEMTVRAVTETTERVATEAAGKAATKKAVEKAAKAPVKKMFGPKKVATQMVVGAASGVVMEATPVGKEVQKQFGALVGAIRGDESKPEPPTQDEELTDDELLALALKRLREMANDEDGNAPADDGKNKTPIAAPGKTDVMVQHGVGPTKPDLLKETLGADPVVFVVGGALLILVTMYLLSEE